MADEYSGKRFGNYRTSHLVGKGGYAWVYKSEHVSLGTTAAVKVLRKEYTGNWEKVAQFYDEARLMAHFHHPHIMRILDCSDMENEQGFHFFVMEYAPNRSLRQFCKPGNMLPLSTVITYIRQSAEALQYAHNRGYIHRDVKLENLLLDAEGNVVLSDFGIAVAVPESPHDHVADVGGTIDYMPPEQLRRMPVPASDQYALAIVTYMLLTGDCPFHGTSAEIAHQQKHVNPPSLRSKVLSIPPAVERVVLKALAKDPRMRFPSVRAYALALEHAYSERVAAPPRHSVNRQPQGLQTRRLPVDVQSHPPVSQGISADIQSEPMPAYLSSAMQSEPSRALRPRPGSVPARKPVQLAAPVQQQRQPAHAQQQREHAGRIHPAKLLNAFDVVGRMIAAIFFSAGMGAALLLCGVGQDVAFSLAAVILLMMFDIVLLGGWAALVVPLLLLLPCVGAGILCHSLTVFGFSVVFMNIVEVVSALRHRHN